MAKDSRFLLFFSKCKFIEFDEKNGDKNLLTSFQTFKFSNKLYGLVTKLKTYKKDISLCKSKLYS